MENPKFTKMAEINAHFFISAVIHKTHIEVSEAGTKAAAVTGVELSTDCVKPVPDKEIILNRPFIYAIVDTETHLPVFFGTVGSIE